MDVLEADNYSGVRLRDFSEREAMHTRQDIQSVFPFNLHRMSTRIRFVRKRGVHVTMRAPHFSLVSYS